MNISARHGRLPRRGPVKSILAIVASTLAVVMVAGLSLAAIAFWQINSSFKDSVDISIEGQEPPTVGPITGPVNILLVGSDSGGGNPAYGERGETLNDVTILLHISPVSHTAIAVSLPRDMFVPIADCKNGSPGTRKMNEALYYGGLACAVATVQNLTGLKIGYAAQIEFDGVIAMSQALGGVEVCVAKPIHDLQINFDLSAGKHKLKGWNALMFLRSRHGVGDGSDTTRISNQQLFLSAMMRQIKSADTLGNPVTVYALASAAAKNMTLSTSLRPLDTMASMALAVKDIPLKNIAFVTYPSGAGTFGGQSGVLPRAGDAAVLMDAIAKDARIEVASGAAGGGVVAGGQVDEPEPTPTGSGQPTIPPDDNVETVKLPSSITGQQATEETCTAGQTF
ncbi:MAG TPA: LCP family protein [Pseudolysinimonas sp.]|nr:LCP family protein [Pseudolysinimonas sp.]